MQNLHLCLDGRFDLNDWALRLTVSSDLMGSSAVKSIVDLFDSNEVESLVDLLESGSEFDMAGDVLKKEEQ